MRIAGWKAWYTQGRVYSSKHDTWGELPKYGVLLVLVFFDKTTSDGTELYKEILSGARRYFQAQGSSGNVFMKQSMWNQQKLLDTYDVLPDNIKEGVWDDDETMESIRQEALETNHWG